MSTPNEESAALKQFATKHGQSFELPELELPIEEEKNPFFQWLTDWLAALLPQPDLNLNTAYLTPEAFYQALLFVGSGLILIVLAFMVWRLLQKTRTTTIPSSATPKSEFDDVIQAMRTALDQGHYDEWTRLRWQLFLLRNSQLSSTTPQEYLQIDASFDQDFIKQLYAQMFHHASDKQFIAAIDQRLTAREQNL